MIEILSPRYRDRTILIAPWKIAYGHPAGITIKYGAYKGDYTAPWKALKNASTTQIKTKTGKLLDMLVVSLDDLERKYDED